MVHGKTQVFGTIQMFGLINKKKIMALVHINNGDSGFNSREKINNSFDEVDEKINKLKNTIFVSPTGGEFSNVKDALSSITTNTPSNPWTIIVAPGIYLEDNPIQCKEYVSVISLGGQYVTTVEAQNSNHNMFNIAKETEIEGFTIKNISGTGFSFNQAVPGKSYIKRIRNYNCSNGFKIINANAEINIIDYTELNESTGVGYSFYIGSGFANINSYQIDANSIVDTAIYASGASSQLKIHEFFSKSSNLTTGFKFNNNTTVIGTNNNIRNAYDGMIINGKDTVVTMDVLKIIDSQNKGFQILGTDTGLTLNIFATTVIGSTDLNFSIENPNSTLIGNGLTELNNVHIIDGAKIYAYFLDVAEDDEGLNILGELHVGTPENPTESAFGEGDSYTNGMLVYTYNGTTYSDISDDAKSASGSTFSFPNISADTAIYVASERKYNGNYVSHFGIKTKVVTAGVMGTGSIICEFWNGIAWEQINIMETQSNGKYYPYANKIFQNAGSHHIRINSKLVDKPWTANDPMSIGTNYFWLRYRIVSAITTAPIFEQWKIHSNRNEINGDGWAEYFGKARTVGQLAMNFNLSAPFEGTMGNQKLYISQNLGVGDRTNQFNSINDKLGVTGYLPLDLDTSSPIKIEWSGRPTTTGTYSWIVRWGWVSEGDSINTTEPGSPIANSDSVTVSQKETANELAIFHAYLNVSQMIARRPSGHGDEIWISLTPVVLAGNFTIEGSQTLYTKWCEGGHV